VRLREVLFIFLLKVKGEGANVKVPKSSGALSVLSIPSPLKYPELSILQ
jgi:hypothetical protein